jgi:predicted nucleotidyltransferase
MNNDDIKLSGLTIEETYKIIPRGTVLLGYMGSISHGTAIPKSHPDSIDDIDIMGVGIWNKDYYFGLPYAYATERIKSDHVTVMKDEWDATTYEIRKFVKLLLKQNPNVLSLIWLPEKDYIHISNAGKRIIENRDIFSSKEVYHSYVGYAKEQFYKMEHYSFDGYMGAKRKELVMKYGFDLKNASHLIRLLRRGIEFLTDGKLQVFCKDNQELKDIKLGKWSLEKVKAEAEILFKLAMEAFVRSPLPAKPDYAKAEQLLIDIIEEYFYG